MNSRIKKTFTIRTLSSACCILIGFWRAFRLLCFIYPTPIKFHAGINYTQQSILGFHEKLEWKRKLTKQIVIQKNVRKILQNN